VLLGKRRESARLADRVGVAKRNGTTQPIRSQGPVGRGGREQRLEAGWSEKPTRIAGGLKSDAGAIKLGGRWRYVDLVLHSGCTLRQGRVDRKTPRLEAGLGRTQCPEF